MSPSCFHSRKDKKYQEKDRCNTMQTERFS